MTATTGRQELDERPKKFATLVAQRIVRAIVGKKLKPGDMLPPEHAMLQEYQVGRGTLREALRYLELQGVISIRPGPGGGPMVREPNSAHLASTLSLLLALSMTEFSEFVEARRLLEPVVAGYAATRVDDASLEELRQSCVRLSDSVGDIDAFNDENRNFHERIAWLSGNHLLGFNLSALHRLTISSSSRRFDERAQKAVVRAHESIYTALAARDAAGASAAMAAHLQEWVDRLNRRTPELLREPITWSDLR